MSGQAENALAEWAERENWDTDDRDAPHVQAFLAGYDAALALREIARTTSAALAASSETTAVDG